MNCSKYIIIRGVLQYKNLCTPGYFNRSPIEPPCIRYDSADPSKVILGIQPISIDIFDTTAYLDNCISLRKSFTDYYKLKLQI